jgi:glycerophosphoryl diester phosphodiesterase
MSALTAQANEPLIVAHRGASKDAPENTIPAFELAWQQGADAIEGDFHLTKDGYIVCVHDKDTETTSGKRWPVLEKTLKEILTLDVGSHHSAQYKGTRIPTIAEVFATVPVDKKMYIEVKGGKAIVPSLIEEIRKSGLKTEQIVVIAFDKEVIREIKIQAPQFKACWLSDFKENNSGELTPSTEVTLETLRDIRADGFSSTRNMVNAPYIKTIIEHGFEYHVWTVDDLEIAKRFKDWGALSITTNRPGYIKDHLNQ